MINIILNILLVKVINSYNSINIVPDFGSKTPTLSIVSTNLAQKKSTDFL